MRPLIFLLLCLAAGAARGDAPVTIFAAGDIADCDSDGAARTGSLLAGHSGPILALGDLAYPRGSSDEFLRCFDPVWGRFKGRIVPVPGNHEYGTPDAAGYFEYFGASAGNPGEGWHSRAIGAWRIIGLNSNLVGAAAAAQLRWLDAELAANRQPCTLAFFHHPRFSSGKHGNQDAMDAVWRLLAGGRATLVLAGHDHHYERFAPRDADGRPDPNGTRSFVVGTGGARLYQVPPARAPSEFTANQSWGVLKLELSRDGYRWEFQPVESGAPADRGTGRCQR